MNREILIKEEEDLEVWKLLKTGMKVIDYFIM